MLTPIDLLLAALAALAAGAVNSLAGGGTLISFPALMFLGAPSVAANVTNTVAMCVGHFGAVLAQRDSLHGQTKRLWSMLPAGMAGGVLGGYLLLISGEKLFNNLIPYLILLSSILLAVQDTVRAWLTRRSEQSRGDLAVWTWLPVAFASIYGGYFGAGLGVVLLSVLGLTLTDSLIRLNALKQAISFVVNTAAAVFFLFSGQVVWTLALVMGIGALIGGALGGRIANRINPSVFKWVVVFIGVVIAIIYFVRG